MFNSAVAIVIMSSLVSKKKHEEEEEDGSGKNDSSAVRVTSQLCLKPTQAPGTLDKEVVLRRIRQRKRVNNVKKAFQSLLSYPFSSRSPDTQAAADPQAIIWADDPFVAP